MNRISTIVSFFALFCLWMPDPGTSLGVEAFQLEARDELQWRRGNMHTHSHWSDGDDYLESIALWYRDHGYDFLVFTDHNVLATTERWEFVNETKGGQKAFDKLKANFPDWVDTRTRNDKLEVRLRRFGEVAERFNNPGEYLLIQGEEISDSHGRAPVHLNASNLVNLIRPQGGSDVYSTIQNNVLAVLAQREETGQPMIVHLNHPNFGYAVTAEDLMRVRGEKFFEVYNGHPSVNDAGDATHASTDRIWDIVLSLRLGALKLPVMYGLAVDDCHNYHGTPRTRSAPGRGWVQVLTRELTATALIEALEAGKFYASSGVALRRIVSDGKSLVVEVDAEKDADYTIEFIGTRRSANLKGEPVLADDDKPLPVTHKYSEQIGEVLARVDAPYGEYRFKGDEMYVRARVTSSQPHPDPSERGDVQMAWTQPVIVAGVTSPSGK